ncbi:MAG: hypothetical protein ACE5FA_09260, partial [Dehalococcoidia bacterium]
GSIGYGTPAKSTFAHGRSAGGRSRRTIMNPPCRAGLPLTSIVVDVGVGIGVGIGVGEGEGVGVGLGDGVGAAVVVGVGDAVADASVAVGDGDGEGLGDAPLLQAARTATTATATRMKRMTIMLSGAVRLGQRVTLRGVTRASSRSRRAML